MQSLFKLLVYIPHTVLPKLVTDMLVLEFDRGK
jgi:hypothetical protein